jgi:hypothetical protein
MKRCALFVAVVPLVLALSGCVPASNGAQPTAPASASPSSAPTPGPPAAVDTATYLLKGKIGNSSKTWSAIFGFYTDDAKDIRCDISVNSKSPGRTTCEIVKGHEKKVTYDKPSKITDQCVPNSGFYRGDGYQVGLGLFQAIGQDTGFYGCREGEKNYPWFANKTKVLPDNSYLEVKGFRCTVESSVVTCAYTKPTKTASFTFGLDVANFHF